ncbi:MAG: DUF456 domain-containing protein [Trichlorobacter sp.]|uniref:DUF456 domain-containing protein n=1 Tax=Trichlorobacter sp. TaxID=2911007 RepID=UPI00256CBADC|nr:DUF456 domain-containing protein [Trichlorobacter sp.]MDK9716931.1 DUF456 domain-containing protein [Trichlorobacter sp.]
MSILIWGLSAVLTVTGLAGMFLPILPGAPILFLGLLFGAWAEDFHYVGLWTLLVLAIMAGLTYLVEFAASVLGVKKYGGSTRAMAGAAAGGVVGLFFGIPGILLGPFIGAVVGELSLQRTMNEASRAGFGTVVGLALGLAGKLAIGIAMVGLFVVMRFVA